MLRRQIGASAESSIMHARRRIMDDRLDAVYPCAFSDSIRSNPATQATMVIGGLEHGDAIA